jgi:hypothetical protein
MIIKDEIWGTIEFDDFEKRIIDTPDFQRLRRIKQMSFTNLVYPGANHTRFEHSLGTAHLSGLICERLGLDKDTKKKVKLYGLLHDIGHTAFSHEGEDIVSKLIGDHESLGEKRMRSGPLADVLCENYKPHEILELGKMKEGQIVDSDIGADRMDYLKRDALNTGVAYGVIDIDRIIHTLAMDDDDLVIEKGGLESAESLLVARFMMFSAVYLHHTVRIATAMLGQAITRSIEDGTVDAKEFASLTDDEAMNAMKKSIGAKPYVDGLVGRSLYKEVKSLPNDLAGRKEAKVKAEKIRQSLNCDVLVDFPSPIFKPIDFKVKTDKGTKPIMELSQLVSSLKTSEEERMKILVLVPPQYRKAT